MAFLGASADFVLYLRKDQPRPEGKPIIMISIALILAIMGALAMIVLLLLTGKMGPSLIMGFGVMTGFYSGFILLTILWVLSCQI